MFFHPKNFKSENHDPWFESWFNILLHPQSIVCVTVDSQCLEYLGYITLHCDCTMKYWFIKKEWHSLQKNCQENQKNIHWNSVTTSGYGPTDATAELTWPWPSTTLQWGQNFSEVVFDSLFSYFFCFFKLIFFSWCSWKLN